MGGIVSANVRTALSGIELHGYTVIAGLGGRSITRDSLRGLFEQAGRDELEPSQLPRPERRARRARAGPHAGGPALRAARREHAPRPRRRRRRAALGAGRDCPTRRSSSTRRGPSWSEIACSILEERSVQARTERSNTLTSGHRACQGCGEALGARYVLDSAMRATGGKLIAANATGCLEVFSTPYPESSWQLPWIHSLFGNAPAVSTGIAAALKAKGRDDIRVIGQGGDGGTLDIGFGCLSGMFERNDDVLFVCYDNEAYMNTGVQRSGATPPGARTANTKPVGEEPGNVFGQGQERAADRDGARDSLRRHRHRRRAARPRGEGRAGDGVPRGAATCTSSFPARSAGALPPQDTIKIARLVKETGLFPVFEAEDGEVTGVSKIRKQVPVDRVPEAAEALRATCSEIPHAHRCDRGDPGARRPQHPPLRPAQRGLTATTARPAP